MVAGQETNFLALSGLLRDYGWHPVVDGGPRLYVPGLPGMLLMVESDGRIVILMPNLVPVEGIGTARMVLTEWTYGTVVSIATSMQVLCRVWYSAQLSQPIRSGV